MTLDEQVESYGAHLQAEAFGDALTRRVLAMQARGPVTREALTTAAAEVAAEYFPPPRVARVTASDEDGRITFNVTVSPAGPVTYSDEGSQ